MGDQDTIGDHDELSLWLQSASIFSNNIPIDDITHQSFEVHSLFPRREVNDGEGFEAHSLFPRREVNDGEVCCSKDVVKTSNEGKTNKRKRSKEIHNFKEKLRRQRLTEKVYTIQELIPNCDKGDTASILDEAVKYISTLLYQIKMMSMGEGFPMVHSPLMPQPGLQEMQIPCLGPFPQTGPLGGGTGIGTGMSAMFPSFNSPTSQLGLPHQDLLTPLATSTLPAPGEIPAAAHSIQYSGNLLESLPSATSSMDLEALCGTFSGFQSTTGGENGPAQGAPSSTMESRPSIDVISEVRLTSTLPAPGGIPAAAHSNQDLGNVLEPLPSSTSSMDLEALYATFLEFQSTIVGESVPSQGTPSSTKESTPSIDVISEV